MNTQEQAMKNFIDELAGATAAYLDDDEVQALAAHWQHFDKISVAMMQPCMLDVIKLYPKTASYKSEIRRQLWRILQAQIDPNAKMKDLDDIEYPDVNHTNVKPPNNNGSAAKRPEVANVDTKVLVFYAVIDAIKPQLSQDDILSVFTSLQYMVEEERKLKKYTLDMRQFASDTYPSLPDSDSDQLLNTLVQLMYVSLCEIVGPCEADDILYHSAQAAKQQFPSKLVESLF